MVACPVGGFPGTVQVTRAPSLVTGASQRPGCEQRVQAGSWALLVLPSEGETSSHLPLLPGQGEALKGFKQGWGDEGKVGE